MTSPAIAPARSAGEPRIPAEPAAGPATAPKADGRDPSPDRRSPWWRRLQIPSPRWQPTDEARRASLEKLLSLLEAARGELAAGWVQRGCWVVPAADGQPTLATGLAAGLSRPPAVSAVCLVGALVRASSAQGPDGSSEVGRAIGAVYDALWESRGQPATRSGPGLLAVSSPQNRLAQIQTLTRWNDAAGRCGEEVLGIVDRAIARTILSMAALPAASPLELPERDKISKPAAGTAPEP